MMSRNKKTLLLLCTIICFNSCVFLENSSNEALDRAENLIEHYPDSAFQLLNIEIQPEKLDKDQYNKYILLYIEAKDKSLHNIAGDTLVFGTKRYFATKNDKHNAAWASYYSGRVMAEQNLTEEAMHAYQEALDYTKIGDNYVVRGLIECGIGDLYMNQTMISDAADHYKQAADYFKTAEKYKYEIYAYNKLTSSLLLQNKSESSLYYLDKALTLAKQHNDISAERLVMQKLGIVYTTLGNTEEAEKLYRNSLILCKTEKEKAEIYISMSANFNKEKNMDSTMFYMDKALELVGKYNIASLRKDFVQALSNLEENGGNHGLTLNYYKKYIETLDHQLIQENEEMIPYAQEKYIFEKLLNEKKSLLTYLQFAILLVFVLIIIALTLVYTLRRKKRQHEANLLNAKQTINKMKEESNKFQERIDQAEERVIQAENVVNSINKKEERINKKEEIFRKILFSNFNILKKVALLKNNLKEDEKKHGQRLLKKINEIVYNKESLDWDILFEIMGQLYSDFPKRLHEKHSHLDEVEFKICCLIYGGFNNTEISVIMEFSINTIQMKKTNIRKKLGIEGYGNILEFLKSEIPVLEEENYEVDVHIHSDIISKK